MSFVPKLATTMRAYTRQQFTADATAGVIVGIVALPLSMAIAIASGATPAPCRRALSMSYSTTELFSQPNSTSPKLTAR